MPWTCQLCGDQPRDITDLINHLRLIHPDVDREVEWPTPSDAFRSSTPDR